ncbi:site-specific DNA-methyltransferase [Anoxybacillus flavithermus]|uniref:Site-specific DNA-methyltransferase n=1 Tax=Anoxybacillus flavithermus TaxID=33934 RepID=A0A2G5RMD4_9BACL|nr:MULTISPECIES: site-specific DNA-methyltransferase [Anoxybacillus]KFZ42895.1 DNA methylase N-4 [Anoxybacillus sp. KU2-6(11)]PIC03887.1 site-specific DNA-methyltransferase [Anoxybacillus flavithermus]
MEKLDGKSLDLVQTNIEALKQLFPEVVTEGKIDFEKLKLVLGEEIEKRNERYEFTWHGKTQAMKLAQTPSTGTLRPDKQSSKNWDTTENLYIEGDNLEVLKLLQKSYFGKIKMIYIDPPYNTGKDFVYKDDFRDNIKNYKEMTQQTTKANTETNGRYHTDWLNMMYPRLKLARNLLREDGFIFVSINDSEQANLKKIMDEIYGEDHFLAQIIIQSNKRGQTYKDIANTHEYLLLYSKSEQSSLFEILKQDNSLPYEDKKGKFDLWELRNRNPKFGRHNRPNLYFPIYVSPSLTDENGYSRVSLKRTNEYFIEVYPKNSQGKESCWRWSSSKIMEEGDLGSECPTIIARQKQNGDWNIYEKSRKSTTKPKSLWNETEVINEQGTIELGILSLGAYFDHPKPIHLVKKILTISSEKNDIILDFFSGSATTAHAVMQLNAEDGGNRKFIMVQLPEPTAENSEAYKAGYKNICEIGKERIRRAGEKIVQETGKTDLDIGFKVFKLDSSNVKPWDPDFENFEKDLVEQLNNLKEDRTKEDLLYEILLKIGLPLTTSIEEIDYNGKTIYNVGFGAVLLCLENDIDLDIVHEMMKHKSEHLSPKVIFKESGFMNDSVKINAIQTLKKNGINDVRSV